MKELIICPISNYDQLDLFLLSLLPISKNQCKEYFSSKELKKPVRARSEVRIPLNLLNSKEVSPVYKGPSIQVIAENEYFLVLNKPKKIHVHPLTYDEPDNCVSFVRQNFLNYHKVNSENYDRGFLYRLDFETSGVLIYVKNDDAYKDLRKNFDQITKEKIYYATVSGQCEKRGLVEHFIKPYGPKGAIMVLDPKPTEKSFKAKLEILEGEYDSIKNETCLKIKLFSGHRHQIRIQLKSLGLPIVGDELYQGSKASELKLHAFKYLINYQNKDYAFEANCPKS